MAQTQTKEYAHELIDRMAPGQVSVVVNLLEVMLDPVACALANAPYDDETISEEEAREIEADSQSWGRDEGTPNREVLREFGLTEEDFERMGRTPVEADGVSR